MLNRMKFAGIAAGLALVATPGVGGAQVDRMRQQAEERRQAAAAEAARQQQGQQAPGQQQAALAQHGGPEVKDRLQHLHSINQRSIELAKLAAERGSPRVQSFGERMAGFHREVDASIRQLSQERGVQIAEGADMEAQFAPLRQASGQEFDQQIVEKLVEDRIAMVDELKALRDATPGRDAELKGWLDQVEMEMENQRNLARQVRQEVRSQREARPATR